MISGVYVITDVNSGKRYVGSATNIGARWNHHRGRLRAGRHRNDGLQKAWQSSNGIGFIFQMLEAVERRQLIEREQFWSERLCACGPRGFNILPTAGSHAGRVRSLSTRTRLSLALRGNKNGIGNTANRGRSLPEETRRKMSVGRIGNRNSAGNKNHLGHTHSAAARARIGAASRAAWAKRKAGQTA